MLNTIEGLLLIGFIVGLVVGLTTRNKRTGCTILFAVPVLMIGYIVWWQSQHPENLRSTSALDFMFGPLWPSVGAYVGFEIAKWMLGVIEKRKKS